MTRSRSKLAKEKNKTQRSKGKAAPKIRKKRPPVKPTDIKNYARRTQMVIRHKIAKSKESVQYKMEKRKMEANGQVFEKFDPVSQEDRRMGPYQIENELLEEREKLEKQILQEGLEQKQEEVDLTEDLKEEFEYDEFAPFVNKEREPKIFLTTMFNNPTKKTYLLMQGKVI